MKVFAFIFARGGSKGLPGKNIKNFACKPLIAHSIELAQKMSQIDEVFVSTDSEEICNVARAYKAKVINRPSHLAQDESPEWHAWQHAIKWLDEEDYVFDVFLSLPPTAPLRAEQDVENCLNKLDARTDFVITGTEADRSPWFNMVKQDKEGFSHLLIEGSGRKYSRRQDVPKAYDMTTVAYVTRPEFIKTMSGIFEGKVKCVEIPKHRSLDIDTELDFRLAEFLFLSNK